MAVLASLLAMFWAEARTRDEGQTMAEYALILAGIAVVVGVVVVTLGTAIAAKFTAISLKFA